MSWIDTFSENAVITSKIFDQKIKTFVQIKVFQIIPIYLEER